MKVKVRGFRELERALAEELPKATAKNVLRRTGKEALSRLEAKAKELAPRRKGEVADSITTKPAKAKRVSRTRFASSDAVTMLTGPTGREEGGNAAWQEFGTAKMPAHPYMRPAIDTEGQGAVDVVREVLTEQIEKAKARIARKAAKGK